MLTFVTSAWNDCSSTNVLANQIEASLPFDGTPHIYTVTQQNQDTIYFSPKKEAAMDPGYIYMLG